jgi:hypothetical protein
LHFLLRTPALVRLRNVSLRNGSQDVYRRDFAHGSVIVNYTTEPQLVDLGTSLTRLSLPGSPVFDGRTTQADVIPSADAMIYLKQPGADKAAGNDVSRIDAILPQPLRLTLQTVQNNTSIEFELPQAAPVSVRVFDVRGRLVRELQPQRPTAAGVHHLLWAGNDAASRRVAAGVYLIQLQTPTLSTQRKMVLVH